MRNAQVRPVVVAERQAVERLRQPRIVASLLANFARPTERLLRLTRGGALSGSEHLTQREPQPDFEPLPLGTLRYTVQRRQPALEMGERLLVPERAKARSLACWA